MKTWTALLALIAFATPAFATNTYNGTMDNDRAHPPAIIYHEVTFDANSVDSRAFDVGTSCSATFVDGAGGDVAMWEVSTPSAAASSGTLRTTFTTTTTLPYTWSPGKKWIKFLPASSALGATVTVTCAGGISGGRGGSSSDSDQDGLYEVAYLWDADGDGSSLTTCTAASTPDIRCKAIGEVLNPDTVDDVNCAVHGCGNGRMERDGTLILPGGVVHVLFPCWRPGSTDNDALAGETNDDEHDQTSDTAAGYCATDADGNRLSAISFQGWQGTLLGEGIDPRDMQRANMGASLRRDRGTYVTNDMGPWHTTAADNVWFGGGNEMVRAISSGFNTTFTNTTHHTGASAAKGDSKGWGKILEDVNWEGFGPNIRPLCLQNSGGSVGSTHSADSWVSTLARGDRILVPVMPSSTAATYLVYEVVVKEAASGACGAGNVGLRVGIGGTKVVSADGGRSFPPYAGQTNTADNVYAGAARSNYDDTRVTIANMTVEPQDPWNEDGGRCTESGTPFAVSPNDKRVFVLTGANSDNVNTDFSCDTMPLFGMWGGGSTTITNVIIKNWHQYAIDGGMGGGVAVVDNVKWLYGNGGPAWDAANGWILKNSIVDQSQFNANVFSHIGPGTVYKDNIVQNSLFTYILNLNKTNEGTIVDNLRAQSTNFNTMIYTGCGAKRNSIKTLYSTGRSYLLYGGVPGLVQLDCATKTDPITQNYFSDIWEDSPGSSPNNEAAPIIVYTSAGASGDATLYQSITGNIFEGVRSTGYSPGSGPDDACLFGVTDWNSEDPPDDDGESVVFTYNTHSNSHVIGNGRVFCITAASGSARAEPTDSEALAVTPSWGDPHGCGNRDGNGLITYARCDGAELGNGTITADVSVTAGTCSTIGTSTLTGLATTDSIVAGFTGDPGTVAGRLIISGAASANTVTLRACNTSAGTLDPASATWWWKAYR